jgi:hypothetical protein
VKLLTFRDGAGLKLGVGTDAGAIDVEAATAALAATACRGASTRR